MTRTRTKTQARYGRANLDGSNVEDLVAPVSGVQAHGIALDLVGGKMYWTEGRRGTIQRANFDGTNVEDLVTNGLRSPGAIALDIR